MLVQASDFSQALARLIDGMKGTLADYEVASIAETALIEVYQYTLDEEAKPE